MGAKRSSEMKLALQLVRKGMHVQEAADAAGVHRVSLYVAMRNQGVKSRHSALRNARK